MEIIFSDEFKKEFKKIKDKSLRLKIIKHLKKLAQLPESGKPLKYEFKKNLEEISKEITIKLKEEI